MTSKLNLFAAAPSLMMANPLDPLELKTAIDKANRAGIPRVIAEVRDGDQGWRAPQDMATSD